MGCATLINTVANFQIPKDLCEEMDALSCGGTQKIAPAITSPQWLWITYVIQRIKEV